MMLKPKLTPKLKGEAASSYASAADQSAKQASSSADQAGSAATKYPEDPAIKSSADLAKSAADDAAIRGSSQGCS